MTSTEDSIRATFHAGLQFSRETLYGGNNRQLPPNLQADARLPSLGYCGPNYKPGGIILMGINPGGGGMTTRTALDVEQFTAIERFRASNGNAEAFRAIRDVYHRQIQSWKLRRIVMPTLEACGAELDEVCFLNVFPYRTAKERLPSAHAINASIKHVIKPLLQILKPSMIITLGKKAGNVVARKLKDGGHRLHVVQRTRGDTHVCKEARRVLGVIRSQCQPKSRLGRKS